MAIKKYQRGDSTKLSPHFRAREFDCCGKGCCAETKIDEALVSYLEQIRQHFGKPLYIGAGYRCEAYNKTVPNAASQSKHLYGMAADVKMDGVDPLEIARYAEAIGVKGIGHYDTFVHIDTRTDKSFWYSHKQEYRQSFGSGEYGLEQFVRDVQSACGAKVDGIAGPETLGKTVTLSAQKNRSHKAVVAVQKRLYELGYTVVGEADGIAGVKFEAAVIAFQRDNGCWVDGVITAKNKTWRKLLGLS